ncbi:hypothetical protein LX36DRAFT_728264, partial [Colletotrichum falcatum]
HHLDHLYQRTDSFPSSKPLLSLSKSKKQQKPIRHHALFRPHPCRRALGHDRRRRHQLHLVSHQLERRARHQELPGRGPRHDAQRRRHPGLQPHRAVRRAGRRVGRLQQPHRQQPRRPDLHGPARHQRPFPHRHRQRELRLHRRRSLAQPRHLDCRQRGRRGHLHRQGVFFRWRQWLQHHDFLNKYNGGGG